ncbi:MAG: hypothetical protein NZ693_06820 [Thermoflexales bacterium]|nr:hypothetical protein [Thermoflexales bacterium]
MLSTSGQFEDGVFIILPERKITCLSVQSGTSVIVSIHAIDNDRLMLYLDDLSVLGFSIPVGYLYKRAQP